MSGNAGYKKEFFLELSNNETSSFKRSSSSRDEEPVTSCTSLPAMPYASLPFLVQAGMFQIFGTWLYHIHIYYICRSVDQQGDSDSKYIFPFDPYTESDISIPGPFCCSEAYPSSIAVGYIFRDVSPKTMNSVPVSFFAGPGNEIIYIALPTSFRQRSPRYFLSITS